MALVLAGPSASGTAPACVPVHRGAMIHRTVRPGKRGIERTTGVLAPCYHWILRETIRAGYMSQSDLGAGLPRMKSVGMNALMPKFGGMHSPPTETDAAALARWGRAARTAGLRLLPVINFHGGDSESIPGSRREVTVTGETMKRTPCPLDEAFWNRNILGRMVYLAKHARELGLDGAILDPEMYGSDHTSYDTVCYCDDCMREFFDATGRKTALPRPVERAPWLKRNGLDRPFERRFLERVEGFCRQIEQACHRANPDFLLGTLHPDEPGPFTRGLVVGMGTERYPVLGFSEQTYSTGFSAYIARQERAFSAMGAHVLFVPGIWQQQFPSANLAEQYYACATHSAGYWVYTMESLLEDVSKMPGYALREPADRYWAAIKGADAELDRWTRSGGSYTSPLRIRPFEPPLPVLGFADIAIPSLQAAPDPRPLSLGAVTQPRMRYRTALFILAKAGDPVAVRISNVRLANYKPGTQWVVVDPGERRIGEGHMSVTRSSDVRFTPLVGGVHLIVVDSDSNSHTLQMLTGQRTAFPATEHQPFTVNGEFGTMYFYVPDGVQAFSLSVKAAGPAPGRGGKVTVFDPDGHPAGHVEGGLESLTSLPVSVPAGAGGRIWAITAADVTNDLTVYFDSGAGSRTLTPDPAKVLMTVR